MDILSLSHIVVSFVLVALILLQRSEGGLGSAFGGEDGGAYYAKRGSERIFFIATIIAAIAFIVLSILALIIRS